MRISDWSSDVCSSDLIVMLSGQPPIQAKKLRYYEDGNFTRRVLRSPVLRENGYADKPAARPDDWSGRALPPVLPVSSDTDTSGLNEDGGLQIRPELDMLPTAEQLARSEEHTSELQSI